MWQQVSNTIVGIIIATLMLGFPTIALASPYFFVDGEVNPVQNTLETWSLYLHADSTLTAAQTVLTFDPLYMTKSSLSNLSSRCSFWAPADPSLGYGNTVAPYFYSTNRVVLSCGFSNPGYVTGSGDGALIATFTLTPIASGSSSFSFSNTLFRYIGNTIAPGISGDFDFTVYESSEAAAAAPTPTPTPNPNATSSGSTVSTAPPTTITDSDLNFIEIGTRGRSGTTTGLSGDTSDLLLVSEDDSIPAPGNLDPRAPATPFVLKKGEKKPSEDNPGDVLSVQSLRELLIPGKSDADRTVVLINLISTLAFLTLLGILIWRLVTTSRLNKVKYQHLTEMLSSELSVLESKLGAMGNEDDTNSVKTDLEKALEDFNAGQKK
jgi:hypothetical protein